MLASKAAKGLRRTAACYSLSMNDQCLSVSLSLPCAVFFFFFFVFLRDPSSAWDRSKCTTNVCYPKKSAPIGPLKPRRKERGEDLVGKFALSRLATLAVSLSPVLFPLFIIFCYIFFLTEREKRKSGMTDFVPFFVPSLSPVLHVQSQKEWARGIYLPVKPLSSS